MDCNQNGAVSTLIACAEGYEREDRSHALGLYHATLQLARDVGDGRIPIIEDKIKELDVPAYVMPSDVERM